MALLSRSAKVAVIQMNIIQGDVHTNLDCAVSKIESAVKLGAELICLPEAFATGINFMQLHKVAEHLASSVIVQTISDLARAHKVYIIAGIIERSEKDEIFDTAIVINPDGHIEHRYRRRVLWSGEIHFLEASSEQVTYFDTKFGRIGLIIGYELFFPSLCTDYFTNNVVMIVCLANIFSSLKSIVPAICQARAYENQCYFVFASSIGTHTLVNDSYMGGSSIFCNSTLLPKRLVFKIGTSENVSVTAGNHEDILCENLHLDSLKSSKERFFRGDFERYYSGNPKL
ncbi:carbon-nitrogen hydrolase family protein [Paenibacillus sp. NPDC057934]|uniref:carbon-nitrogen hydrolase family protein n=1 Tax=Paenibacillus sp. NPDC057934 TaxID=3346282 RepID=UPI0036D94E6C